MMFLSALNVGALKVMLRRNSFLGWEERGAKLWIGGLAETRGRKQKNDVRKSDDPTTIEGQPNSHRKTSFLFLRSASGALCETRRAAIFSVLLRERMILEAIPRSFEPLNGSTI